MKPICFLFIQRTRPELTGSNDWKDAINGLTAEQSASGHICTFASLVTGILSSCVGPPDMRLQCRFSIGPDMLQWRGTKNGFQLATRPPPPFFFPPIILSLYFLSCNRRIRTTKHRERENSKPPLEATQEGRARCHLTLVTGGRVKIAATRRRDEVEILNSSFDARAGVIVNR